MLKFINLQKLTAKTLIGLLMVSGLIAQSSNKQAAASDVQGLELYYQDSAFQCRANGAQADISVYVYNQANELLETMSKGDRYVTSDVDSVNDLKFRYQFDNVNCFAKYKNTPNINSSSDDNEAPAWKTLKRGDALPVVGTYGSQASIGTMLNGLDSYEELHLVELASENPTKLVWEIVRGRWKKVEVANTYYDLQDVILVVDNNPESLIPDPTPDPEPEINITPSPDGGGDGDVDNNGILDSKEIDSDIDIDGLKNFEDLDDDGDGIADVHELYTLEQISSTGTKVMTHKLTDGTEITVTLPNPPSANILPAQAINTDGVDQPDYQDTNTDNDKFLDKFEAGDTDLATAPFNSDSSISGDSIADFRDLDSDDNGIIDDNEVESDIDIDEVQNFQDLDDDGDGIIDLIEIGSNPALPTNSDNGSGNPDYQDTDSDNDGILDNEEGVRTSTNGATAISISYPDGNSTTIVKNLQDSNLADTKKDGVVCVSEDVASTCVMTSTPSTDGDGKVVITGTMTGLDYQVPAFAD